MVLNLIVNAAHAIQDVAGREGTEKGVITIRTRPLTDWVEVKISDTGGGIPQGCTDPHLRSFLHHQDNRQRNRTGTGDCALGGGR